MSLRFYVNLVHNMSSMIFEKPDIPKCTLFSHRFELDPVAWDPGGLVVEIGGDGLVLIHRPLVEEAQRGLQPKLQQTHDVFSPLCRRSWSTLVQEMVCCLMVPSHGLNQCWLIFNEVFGHLFQGNVYLNTQYFDLRIEIYITEIIATFA